MMVETRPVGFCSCLLVFVVVLVIFSTIRLTFLPFNDDLGTMPTRRPYSWKKKVDALLGQPTPDLIFCCQHFILCWTCFRGGRTIAKAITLICRGGGGTVTVFHVRVVFFRLLCARDGRRL